MTVPFVDLKLQYESIKPEIDEAIFKVIEQTSFIGGDHIKRFEKTFSEMLGAKHCIAVANGTDAIYIALKMLGIGSGDEVITTAASWISTSETISQTGAKPVFVDIDPETFTIDVSKIESKINSKTKAILPVHLYGQAAHIGQIKKICDQHRVFLIEDCAQAHFTKENDQYVGTFGIASTFSFYPGKNLGAYGDAGAIVTNDDVLAKKMRMYANHGALVKHRHEMEGINSRLDALQASILSCKARHILKWTEMRIFNAALYTRFLQTLSAVRVPFVRPNTVHTFHLYVIRTEKRDELKEFLLSKGIETAIHYPAALPNLPAYKYLNLSRSDFPVASAHENKVLSLPMFPELTEDQIIYVCKTIENFFSHQARK
jgi:dTDP-4-amino-4,6-dideoxygalactose transaminase